MTINNTYNEVVNEILTLGDMIHRHNTGNKFTNEQVISRTWMLEQHTKTFLFGVLYQLEEKIRELKISHDRIKPYATIDQDMLNEILGESELMRLS